VWLWRPGFIFLEIVLHVSIFSFLIVVIPILRNNWSLNMGHNSMRLLAFTTDTVRHLIGTSTAVPLLELMLEDGKRFIIEHDKANCVETVLFAIIEASIGL
jgi:hypothetical protein